MKLHPDVPHGTIDYPFQVHNTICNDGLSLYPHIHPEIELTVITEGNGFFYIDGKKYPVKKGDCIFIAPNTIHLADSAPSTIDSNGHPTQASFFSIVFLPQFLAEKESLIYSKYVVPFLQGNLRAVPLMDGSAGWHKEVLRLAHTVYSLYFQENMELLCHSSMLELWFYLFQHAEKLSVSEPDRANYLLKDTLEFMQNNFAKHLSVADLAARVGLSSSYFTRLFNQYMHTSPIDSLIKIRLQHSTKLLENPSLSISEVALRCGFNDFSYFSKCFRQKYGCSPRAYKIEFQKRNSLSNN